MRVAILGTRGIPGRYGGFETFAEQLGVRLAAKGHAVTVYGRNRYVPKEMTEHRGVNIVRLPAPRSKYLETVVHGLLSAVHALPHRYDIVYVCNSANVPAVVLLLAFRRRVVLNVDGLEWQRAKWGPIGRAYYRACAWAAAKLPAHVVTDAAVIRDYYQRHYGRETRVFPYGADFEPAAPDDTLSRLGLEPRRYILYVSRLEPENNAHVVIAAFRQVETDLRLAIVGDAPYASDYIRSLRATDDQRVVFAGAVYGNGYRVLQSGAALYVQATEVGGTHPALVEAMGRGNAIVANDVPEHREALGDAGRYYRGEGELAQAIQALIDAPAEADALRSAARQRAAKRYSWEAIASAYEAWFAALLLPS
jgi:glycosyltransferase involved in cell wall biosynthesis